MDKSLRLRRHSRIRKYLRGTTTVPRVSVFRSGKHIYVQVVDDVQGRTLVSQSDLRLKKGTPKKTRAYEVGKKLAEKAKVKKITKVVFDRGGFLYHGRVEELARGLREGGIKF
ncbi:50S ribosomal protein L18 [Candidatus Daviesbacteria bacterium]|nr:50S ribosomal protein L18 [Candidatus Daviesbacteria bacterium]